MHSVRSRSPMLLPEESSTLLSVVAFLFVSGGGFILLGIAVALLGKVLGWGFARDIPMQMFPVLFNALVGAGYVWTGLLLFRSKRLGGYIALGTLAVSLLATWLAAPSPRWSDFVVPILSFVAVLASWRYLTPAGRDREPHTTIAPRSAGC